MGGSKEAEKWKASVLSILEGAASTKGDPDDNDNNSIKVKKLRKLVLLSMQLDDDDDNDNKAAKKTFKKTVQGLEEEKVVTLDAEGRIRLRKRKSRHEEKRASKKKKTKKRDASLSDTKDQHDETTVANDKNNNKNERTTTATTTTEHGQSDDAHVDHRTKNDPCKGNPDGTTRLFVGNLPFAVDEASLEDFLPGLTHIKWITDKETGKFYGSAFVELDHSRSAAAAVAKAGQSLMGRPIKVNYSEALPGGDKWPPEKKVVLGGGGGSSGGGNSATTGGQAGGSGLKAMSAKPDNCTKLFIGNLSYDIDDDGIAKFFANGAEAEVKAVRWLHHKDSGDFKGVGFVEFWNTKACESAARLNGKTLLGRPIRIDWTD